MPHPKWPKYTKTTLSLKYDGPTFCEKVVDVEFKSSSEKSNADSKDKLNSIVKRIFFIVKFKNFC